MNIGQAIIDFSNWIWGAPILVLLMGGGAFFLIYSKLEPLRYIGHALKVLTGTYDNPKEKGQINHYQALSTAIAGTVGMGNISGVALAISMGGPGAIFWMWVSAFFGVATKFFTSTLAVMYRGADDAGQIQGGPMYVIREGLSKKWYPLAVLFSLFAMIGVSPMFQANQLTRILEVHFFAQSAITVFYQRLIIGIGIAVIVALVLIGGIRRIGKIAGSLVPVMVVLYLIAVMFIVFTNLELVIPTFKLIIVDAFSASSVLGGAVGSIVLIGVRRAAFSNEAGIGTAPMAHGAAKTNEPVREGMVAMLGPIIDTLIVCTLTALAILITGVWLGTEADGVKLTMMAFERGIPLAGKYILLFSVIIFALTTLFAFPYYGTKAFAFVFGTKYSNLYKILYILVIPVGAVATLDVVVSVFDSAYALMAFPTMISAFVLAPQVKKAAADYFKRLRAGEF